MNICVAYWVIFEPGRTRDIDKVSTKFLLSHKLDIYDPNDAQFSCRSKYQPISGNSLLENWQVVDNFNCVKLYLQSKTFNSFVVE